MSSLVVLLNLERSNAIDRAMWWGPRERGYTRNVREAGLYTAEQALELVEQSRCGDVPVPLEWALAYEARAPR